MRRLYFLLTHFDADKSTRLNIRLLREYSTGFLQELIEPHVVLLSTGSTLTAGLGEEIFIQMPNAGHHEGDLEMLNAGTAMALSRGADLIFKLSSNRIFLNRNKLIELVTRLLHSEQGLLGDYWCNETQLATDVLLMKASFAREVLPLPVAHGAVFSEQVLAEQTRARGLWDSVLLYHERQPIHLANGQRRTGFYEPIELLSNAEHHLDQFITERYPRYLPLLKAPAQDLGGRSASFDFARIRPMAHGGLDLVQGEQRLELQAVDGRRVATMNETAAAIWTMCDGERTVAEIQSELCSGLEVPGTTIAGDVAKALEDFLARRLIWIAGA